MSGLATNSGTPCPLDQEIRSVRLWAIQQVHPDWLPTSPNFPLDLTSSLDLGHALCVWTSLVITGLLSSPGCSHRTCCALVQVLWDQTLVQSLLPTCHTGSPFLATMAILQISTCLPARLDSPALNISWINTWDELLRVSTLWLPHLGKKKEWDWCSHCDGKFFGWLCGGWFPSLCGAVVYFVSCFVSWELASILWDRLFLSIFCISVSTVQRFLPPALIHAMTQPWLSLSLCWTLRQFFQLHCYVAKISMYAPCQEGISNNRKKKQESCLFVLC